MNQKVKEILDGFKNLAYEEKKQVVKEIFPDVFKFLMDNPEFAKEIMPDCLKLLKKMNISITDIMSAMLKFNLHH
ncbi:MAG: hypothetical protein J7L42_01205 [Elusimicrobia bacterium]|nr:hypothetical protein [Elusimicrobiota bacterium]